MKFLVGLFHGPISTLAPGAALVFGPLLILIPNSIARALTNQKSPQFRTLLTLIEPVLIGFLGVTIGSIVIAMYLAMFSLIGKLSQGH